MSAEKKLRVFKIEDGNAVEEFPIRDSHINLAYGVCSTPEETVDKVVTLMNDPGWELKVGSMVSVKFNHNVPAASTLNVDATGAKDIWLHGVPAVNVIRANDVVLLQYDGTRYSILSLDSISQLKPGEANGLATLDSSGKVPGSQLPSYVDDVLEYPDENQFPATGESGKIYVDASTSKSYRWSGTTYIRIDVPDAFTGATAETTGTAGLVPVPAAGDQRKFLGANGQWNELDASMDIDISLPVDGWSDVAPYTYTWLNEHVTDGCTIKVYFLTGSEMDDTLYVEFEKVPGGICFTAPTLPTAPIPVRIHLIYFETGLNDQHPTEGYNISTDVIRGAANVDEALTTLDDKFLTKLDKPVDVPPYKFMQTDADGRGVWGAPASPEIVTNWLDDQMTLGNNTVAVDQSLTIRRAAAEAKETGDRFEDVAADLQSQNSRISSLEQQASVSVNSGYVEDGVAYFTHDGEVLFQITGIGGGGGGGGSGAITGAMTLENRTGWVTASVPVGSDTILSFNWSSLDSDQESTGDGVLRVSVNNISKYTSTIQQGEFTVNVKDYLIEGANSVVVSVTDSEGRERKKSFGITMVNLYVTSSFDASTVQTGAITFPYIPYGAFQKTMIFELDGTELPRKTISASGRQQSLQIPALTHGVHTLRVHFTCTVNNNAIESNTLYYEIMCVEEDNLTPIIASNYTATEVNQYDTVYIPYTVYSPSSMLSNVTIKVNGVTMSDLTGVDRTTQTFSYRFDTADATTIVITSGQTSKTISLTVNPVSIDIAAETEDLALYLSSAGRNNNESNPAVWSYVNGLNIITTDFTDFNWKSDGWVRDVNGDTALRVIGDARAVIHYQPFSNDFRTTGKTIEIEFMTHDVMNYNTPIVSCMSGNRGFQLTAQAALFKSEQSELTMQYKEDDHIRLSFVCEKTTENRLLYVFVNGIPSGVVQYAVDDDFSQVTPVDISIGTNYCAIDLYCIRVYDNDLSRVQLLENWIADTQDGGMLLDRYSRNNVYDSYGRIVISKLPANLPYMILEAPELPQYKGDKKTITGSYTDPLHPEKSFTFTGCQINVQGTSSAPYARKNYDLQFKKGFETQSGHEDNYALTDFVVPFNRFVVKADVASSEGANNVELVKLYCELSPFKSREMLANPKVRQGIYGFPIVIFWTNTDTGEMTFLGKYNFNFPKRAPGPYGYSGDMQSWEFQNNTSNLMLFKSDYFDETMMWDADNEMYKERWRFDYEARFPSDEFVDYSFLQELQSFVVSTDRTTATGNALPASVTYDGVTYTNDTAEYRLAKFRTEFPTYAEVDSFIFYYVFTELFLMIDSRAKNLFIGFNGSDVTVPGRVADRKAVAEPYDMDTAMGTNNEGSLVFTYSLEDTDHQVGGANVFNGQESVLWCNVRDAYPQEISRMYQNMRSSGALSYATVEKRFEDHQALWPEAIWIEDSWFKYIMPLTEPDPGKQPTDAYLDMMQGSKYEQRRWWLSNRFKYIDSKWNSGDALSEVIQFRAYETASLTITPYADIYIMVKYGSYTGVERGQQGVAKTITVPIDSLSDTETYVYSASQIADVGDLSPFKVGWADFSKATRIQRIKIGSADPTYENYNFNRLTLGENKLVKVIDCRNCIGLGTGNQKTVDMSGCSNIEEVYFEGTSINGVTLPNGGVLRKLHLPDTITNLTILNQPMLTEFVCNDYSHISTLRLENIPSAVDEQAILEDLPSGARIRLIGFHWEFNTATEMLNFFQTFSDKRGLDQNGGNMEKPQMFGTVYIPSLTGSEAAQITDTYPDITLEYDHITSQLFYYNWEGTTLLHTETINDGGNGTYTGQPSHSQTAQYTFVFAGWARTKEASQPDATALDNIVADRRVYAAYSLTVRTYTVRFMNSNGAVLPNGVFNNVPYGGTVTYSGADPVHPSDPETFIFVGFSPDGSSITGNTDCVAKYKDTSSITRKFIRRNIVEVDHSNITVVCDRAFAYCQSLTTISLPSATSIGGSAFQNCIALTTVSLPAATGIGTNAFDHCTALTAISLPSATSISDYAFHNCYALTSVSLPAATSIGNYAFDGCRSLTTVSLPVATTIGGNAFQDCYTLTTISLPSATSISDYAFYNCYALTSVSLPSATSISNYAFYNCYALTSVSLPAATSIGGNAFNGCRSLTTVSLPAATSIGNYAFYNCSALTTISLPSATSIGGNVFQNCRSLTTVSLPVATMIGDNAFQNCSALTVVYLGNSSVATMNNSNVFNSTSKAIIYVPDSLVAAYKSATDWSYYASRIKGESELN